MTDTNFKQDIRSHEINIGFNQTETSPIEVAVEVMDTNSEQDIRSDEITIGFNQTETTPIEVADIDVSNNGARFSSASVVNLLSHHPAITIMVDE